MKKYIHCFFYFIPACILSIDTACGNVTQQAQGKDTIIKASVQDASIPGNFSTQKELFFDSAKVGAFLSAYPQLKSLRKEIDTFYKTRDYAFAWFDNKGMIEQAGNLYNRMQNVNDEGLAGKIVYKEDFTKLMHNDGIDSTNNPSAFAELMLTAQYFVYANNVWGGIGEKETKALNWYLPRKKISYSTLLDSLVGGKDLLDSAPVYRQYGLLKNQLKRYKEIERAGGFPKIEPEQKSYKKGDSSAVVAILRNYLFLSGDLGGDTKSPVFDDGLEEGIKSFQRRFGYKDDGVAGNAMFTEMNVPLEKRIQQIEVNMERSRWVPVNISGDYLVINIPEYTLHVYENDTLAWNMNVVVGKPANKTVIFNGDMKYIVFSPYWNIPSGILNKEVLPGIKRNKNYLASHNMEWNGGAVRQKPGPNNSLGLVKFLFPNSFDIYLHDTPSKSLFSEDKRAFSHGCIRLAEPKKLAEYLLRKDSTWSSAKITAAMNSGKEQYVTLKKTMPVFIAYFTAFVDRQGKLNFRNDVYGRDSRLAAAMLDKSLL